MFNKSVFLCVITLCVHLLIVWFLYSPYNELGIIRKFKAEVDSLNKVNDSLYSDIKNNKVIFIGRCGKYKYLNMDEAINESFITLNNFYEYNS